MSPDLLSQVSQILQNGKDLMSNPTVSGAVTGLLGWMKKAFKNNKRAQERLEMIERLEANEEVINQLKTNLDDLLYDNEQLQKELEEKVKEVNEAMAKAGINITKTNTMNINGDNNIGIQDVSGGGNININVERSSGMRDILNSSLDSDV